MNMRIFSDYALYRGSTSIPFGVYFQQSVGSSFGFGFAEGSMKMQNGCKSLPLLSDFPYIERQFVWANQGTIFMGSFRMFFKDL